MSNWIPLQKKRLHDAKIAEKYLSKESDKSPFESIPSNSEPKVPIVQPENSSNNAKNKDEKLEYFHSNIRKSLVSSYEFAHSIKYSHSISTTWTPPKYINHVTPEFLSKYSITLDTISPTYAIHSFLDMKLPSSIHNYLSSSHISSPTPIQMISIPTILSGRDLLGISCTGSGKTLVFTIPLLLFAAEQELSLNFIANEGPVALIVCPSRELAKQTHQVVSQVASHIEDQFKIDLRIMLAIGGTPIHDQYHVLEKGVHVVVGTPGRIIELLRSKMTLEACKHLCLDEADRLIDLGFEEDIRTILSSFTKQRQTLLFSATMPKTIVNFGKSALVDPVVVNIGRAGSASKNVKQEIEIVKHEFKLLTILEALQKTKPRVIIFAENKKDVDDIHEYLLIKGVSAVSLHSGKTQDERQFSINSFKKGDADVLIATDVVSKGLDLPKIKHVINYDMPKQIEDYVHRIGRTGRGSKNGLATTFINRNCSPQLLMDLKLILKEADQYIPDFLAQLEDTRDKSVRKIECGFCGGLGHSITDCEKMEKNKQQNTRTMHSHGDD